MGVNFILTAQQSGQPDGQFPARSLSFPPAMLWPPTKTGIVALHPNFVWDA
jgi:hypothetical protein